ncbi:MAG: CsgG/HfaB family protein [Treponema sp.]|jgi:hypothetical protein|nr:CsgG/HfaB family protein [Treponema sp.]
MKNTIKKGSVIFFGCILLLVVSSCATKVEVQAQRTPTLDTSGIQRIAIIPFEAGIASFVYQNAARHATNTATSRIQATNHFTLVSSSIVNDARRRGENIENFVDALFTGRITRISESNSTQERQHRDRNTGEIITTIYYVREVEVEFTFSFERPRDGSLIGPVTRRGTAADTQDDVNRLTSVDTLVNRVIDSQLISLNRDIAPHTVRISRALERENNRELRPQMEEARTHVRAGNYMAARQIYLDIWVTYQSVAAAVNASILYEAMGETQNAVNLMQQVHLETGSPLASNTLARLNRELSQQAGVEQFTAAQNQNPAERVTSHAIGEIQRVLPSEPRLWIHNSATGNQNLVNNVIDNMISTFLRNGLIVVERQMIDMVLREQNFQMSGYVSDNDFVSIGQLAGANTIVIIDVVGAGAGRRLQVRVLDIRTGNVIMQSGTGSEWHL